MLMWLMSEAKGAEGSLKGLARRLLVLNFSAIHSTAQASHDIFSRLPSPNHYFPIDGNAGVVSSPLPPRTPRTPS